MQVCGFTYARPTRVSLSCCRRHVSHLLFDHRRLLADGVPDLHFQALDLSGHSCAMLQNGPHTSYMCAYIDKHEQTHVIHVHIVRQQILYMYMYIFLAANM